MIAPSWTPERADAASWLGANPVPPLWWQYLRR
jgi:hypothetical protein